MHKPVKRTSFRRLETIQFDTTAQHMKWKEQTETNLEQKYQVIKRKHCKVTNTYVS